MKAIKNLIGKQVIIRSYGAGVFFGTLTEACPQSDKYTVELTNCRRLWRWSGACSITQLAVEGTKSPSECRFTITQPSLVITSVIEIHPCTPQSITSILAVPEWKR